METSEANRVIAEYMGYRPYLPWNHYRKAYKDDKNRVWESFTESLDSLVPVWEKLGKKDFQFAFRDLYEFQIRIDRDHGFFGDGETIQGAAAIATAEAIQEIKNGD